LNRKQRIFVDEYLKCWNASEAARKAGYSKKTAGAIGAENLTKPEISDEIQARLKESHMSADEALDLLSALARGDMAKLMDVTAMGFNLDMQKAQEAGLTKLIKKVKQKTTIYNAKKESEEDREVTELELELYDSQAAIDKILHIHGKFVDKHDITLNDSNIVVRLVSDETS
jgi:phage terminase small subunit